MYMPVFPNLRHATYRLVIFDTFLFVDIFRVATYVATHNYTDFYGLVESTTARKRDAAFHGQRKCRLSKAVARERAPLDGSWERHEFYSHL